MVVECLLVPDYVRMPNGSQDPDLVDCIVDFAGGQVDQFDLFEGVDGLVHESPHLVDT